MKALAFGFNLERKEGSAEAAELVEGATEEADAAVVEGAVAAVAAGVDVVVVAGLDSPALLVSGWPVTPVSVVTGDPGAEPAVQKSTHLVCSTTFFFLGYA